MNILILNGSPRSNGNTASMVDAFVEGAKGHKIDVINIGNKKISGCLACEYCHTNGNGACAQKDDMQEIYPVLKDADMLVIASPVYYFTWTAQMQCAIQRTYALRKPPKLKKIAMLLSSGSNGVYDASIAQYKDIISYMGIQDLGIITSYGSENKSTTKLDEIREFAKQIL